MKKFMIIFSLGAALQLCAVSCQDTNNGNKDTPTDTSTTPEVTVPVGNTAPASVSKDTTSTPSIDPSMDTGNKKEDINPNHK